MKVILKNNGYESQRRMKEGGDEVRKKKFKYGMRKKKTNIKGDG